MKCSLICSFIKAYLSIKLFGGGGRGQKCFPGGSAVKNLPANAGDVGSISGLGRSFGEGNTTAIFLPGKSHGQRSLAGYSLWGHKELDMTEL